MKYQIFMVVKRKRTKDVIEESTPPDKEHFFVKAPGVEARDITDYKKASETSASIDHDKLRKYENENYDKGKITPIHTHPTQTKHLWYSAETGQEIKLGNIGGLHSPNDIVFFLYNNGITAFPLAVRNPKTVEVLGYNFLKKTKKTPKSPITTDKPRYNPSTIWERFKYKLGIGKIFRDIHKYNESYGLSLRENDPSIAREGYDDLLKEYHLRSRFVSADNYQPNKELTQFVPKRGLEGKISLFFGIGGLLSCLIFFSENLTGNVIGINETSSNWIGGILFITGLIGTFFWFRNRKRIRYVVSIN